MQPREAVGFGFVHDEIYPACLENTLFTSSPYYSCQDPQCVLKLLPPGCRILDAGSKNLESASRAQAPGSRSLSILDARSRILHSGSLIQDRGSTINHAGARIQTLAGTRVWGPGYLGPQYTLN